MKTYTITPRTVGYNDEYEVIVVGGGPAGCAAAIASARRGARTLLIEATGSLGGMGTMGLVPAWCPFSDGEKLVYRGIAEEIFFAAKEGLPHVKEEDLDWVPIDPEQLKRVYDRYVIESGAEVLFHTVLSAVDAEDGEIKAILVSNKAGLSAYSARVYIDCTGDADLAAWAGAEQLPFTDKGGYQPATHCFELSNVDTERFCQEENLQSVNPKSPIHEIVSSGKYDIPDTHICYNPVYPGTVGFNAGHIWDVDSTKPETVSAALIRGRQLAAEFQRALAEHQPRTYAASKLSLTAPLMGIRESRRILCDYVLSVEDYRERRSFEDEICRNCYYLDVHHSEEEAELVNQGKIDFQARAIHYGVGESHGIPYRCLTPKGMKNLLIAGRSISTEREVQGSTRVMPVCLCTGEAAGKAAALAKDLSEVDVHRIDVAELRRQIAEDGGYIQ